MSLQPGSTAAIPPATQRPAIARRIQGWRIPRKHIPAFGAGLLLMLLPFVLFWRLWWPAVETRQAFAYGDFTEQYYPMRAFVAYELRHGRLPLWDPFTYSGQPAAGASLYAPFYPLGLWETLFPDPLPFEALEVEALLHAGLAGVFTLLLVRRLTGSLAAGLFSGLAFSLGGFLTSYPVLQLLILETAAWLPAILWLLELALARRSLRYAALAGAALGCAMLAGHPQTFLYIIYLTAAFFLLRARHWRIPLRFGAISAALVAGMALGLSAVQWLPTLELARLSPRAHLTLAEVAHGFAIGDVWGMIRPLPGQWSPLYIGLIPLGLALLAPILWRRAEVWFWAGVALLGLVVSLGANGFLYPLAYRFAPGFALFRNQERAAFLISFALAVLAGYGLAALVAIGKGHRVARGAKRGDPAAPADRSAFVRPPRRRVAAGLIAAGLCLTFLDLFRANAGVVLQPTPPDGYFATTPAIAQIQSVSPPDWRTSSEGLLPGDGNGGLVFRLRDVAGNSPLHLQGYETFLNAVPELRWWQLLNVQHILTRRQLDHGALKLVRQDGDLRLYQVFVQGLPAWIDHAYAPATDQAAALVATAQPELDVRAQAVLEGAPDPAPAPAAGPESVKMGAFEPSRVSVDTQLSAPGILVMSEIAYPGWHVYVSPSGTNGAGQSLPPLRAFGLLRAVALPAGQWHVEWRYEPQSVRLGGLVSILSLLGLALLVSIRKFHQV